MAYDILKVLFKIGVLFYIDLAIVCHSILY